MLNWRVKKSNFREAKLVKYVGEITGEERTTQKEFQRFLEGSLESLAEKLSTYNKRF